MCCNFRGCWLVTRNNREMITRPAIFKWRQTEPGIILCAVRWYLRYSLSLRDVEELPEERGLNVDHTTVWRWVQCYGPELESDCDRISCRPLYAGIARVSSGIGAGSHAADGRRFPRTYASSSLAW
jgi:hypothetical protein